MKQQTSQDIMRSQAIIKQRQAAEVKAQPNRQEGDEAMQELTVRNLNYTRDLLLKDAQVLDQYHSGDYEFVQVAV